MNTPLTGASYTHPGIKKENNEDAIMLYIPQSSNGDRRGLLMVADGVGGHLAGEVASSLAVQTVYDSLIDILEVEGSKDSSSPQEPEGAPTETQLMAILRDTIEEANKVIFEYSQQHQSQAGNLSTTATCGLIYDELLVIAHVGDSRAYRLRDRALQQLTKDHTFVGELVRQGQLSKEAFYEHPRRHVITRALGQKPDVQVDVCTVKVQTGDRVLFCSDGVWEMVRDEGIQYHLSTAASPQEAVDSLFSSAVEAGGVDNIGVVVGDINGG